MGERGRRVRELEVEVLTASEKMAAGAGIHARQMSEQATQLDQCRVCEPQTQTHCMLHVRMY